jgi:hypothetical protein
MKLSYERMHTLLNCIDYDKYKWKICGDLEVLGLLLAIQQGYIKYCCFKCERDSRDKKHCYVVQTGLSDRLSFQKILKLFVNHY